MSQYTNPLLSLVRVSRIALTTNDGLGSRVSAVFRKSSELASIHKHVACRITHFGQLIRAMVDSKVISADTIPLGWVWFLFSGSTVKCHASTGIVGSCDIITETQMCATIIRVFASAALGSDNSSSNRRHSFVA